MAETERIVLSLIPSDADPPLRDRDYQRDLEQFHDALSAHGLNVSSLVELEESVGSETPYLGTFTVEVVKTLVPVAGVIGAAVGAWLHARMGRKVRVKIGETEAEAQTLEEVQELLKLARKFQSKESP